MTETTASDQSAAQPTSSVGDETDSPSMTWCKRLLICAAGVFYVWAIFSSQMLQSANDRSRWCTVWSLVERGTYQIDEIDRSRKWSTIDKVRFRHSDDEPWHFYSSKPPLFPTVVAGLYWLEKNTLGFTLSKDTDTTGRILLVLVNAVPMVLALRSLTGMLIRLRVSALVRCVVLFVAAFSSMLIPFLTTLNNHTPAAVFLVFCLSAMVRIRLAEQARGRDFVIVGATAALTCCLELPAALFGLISFFFVVGHDWQKTLKYYVPAAIVPLALFFATNWYVTGGIKPFYAYYGKEPYVYVHEGIPSYWSDPQGIDANTESTPVYAFHCLLGHHGLLSLTPAFLMSLLWPLMSWGTLFRKGARILLWIGTLVTAIILAFYLTRFENYNYGGNTAALRWMLWLSPFWWLAMVPALERLVKSVFGKVLVAVLVAASTYSVAYSITEPWKPGWIYRRMAAAGIVDYSVKVSPFEPRQFSLIRSVPKADGTTYAWYGVQDAAGHELLMTPEASILTGAEDSTLVRIELKRGEESDEANLVVLTQRLESAGDVTSWSGVIDDTLAASIRDGAVSELELSRLRPVPQWLQGLLRGLPSVRSYNAETSRYLSFKTHSGEKTAIRCRRGAAQVAVESEEHGACRHRCDVLFNDDLPFGLVQWRTTLRSEATGEIVENRLWTTRHLPRD